uniref:B30.2/SPRY domain-containing protein n=1 Tax=Xiphophorus couchianus TaxID=32473 RepID=A0A3B5LPK2_9TELE
MRESRTNCNFDVTSIHPFSPVYPGRVAGVAASEGRPRLPSPRPLLPALPGESRGVPRFSYYIMNTAVSELRDKLLDILRQKRTKTSLTAIKVGVLQLEPEPKTRHDFLKYSQEITLDSNTAYIDLLLSEGNRKTTLMKQQQSYPYHPERFTYYDQVLSRESLTGRCYWEVEWRGEGVRLAVAYRSIRRGGGSDESAFGRNDKSWALRCDKNSYQFWHNNIKTPVSGPVSSRIGVYLDHRAGILSFYSAQSHVFRLQLPESTAHQPAPPVLGCHRPAEDETK